MFVELKDIAKIITGNTPKTSEGGYYSSQDIPFFKPSDFSDGRVSCLSGSEAFLSHDARGICRLAPADSVLCTCIGTIGKVGVLAQESAFNQQINAAFVDTSVAIPRYLAFALLHQVPMLQERANAAVVPIINKTEFSRIRIPLPSIDEQLKKSEVLLKVQHVIDWKMAKLGMLDDLVKSQFVEMFGDLSSNENGWPVLSFDDFATIDTHMTNDFESIADWPHIGIDSIESETGVISGYRTVAEDGVRSGKYPFTERHIIYSKIRPNLNKVALPNFRGVCSADAYPILPTDGVCNREYLAFVMRSKLFLDYVLPLSGRAQMPKVNKNTVRGFAMPVPPYELQQGFATFVRQVDKLKVAIRKAIEKLELLKASLMQEYFG